MVLMTSADGFNPFDHMHRHKVEQVTSEHDLFGDGTVVTVPAYRPYTRATVIKNLVDEWLRGPGARIFHGHDPESRIRVAQAPIEIV